MMDIPRNWPGWAGAHVKTDCDWAQHKAGARVRKRNSEPGDGHPDGTLGTVVGSLGHPLVMNGRVMYFVEWDPLPRAAVGTLEDKVESGA